MTYCARGSLAIPNIFTPAFRERCMTRIKQVAVPASKLGKQNPPATAAVLLPLCRVAEAPSLLYTVRSTSVTPDAGQVSFPGGNVDLDANETPVQAALRITEEAIGLSPCKVDIWGQGPSIPGRSSFLITPVIATILDIKKEHFKINDREVQEVFVVPLQWLCNPDNQFYTQFQNGFIMPVFTTGEHNIWGLTAYLTHILLSSLLPKDYYRNDWMKRKINLKELEN